MPRRGAPTPRSAKARAGWPPLACAVLGRKVYSWGRDDDGRLGLGAQGGRLVHLAAARARPLRACVLDASCVGATTLSCRPHRYADPAACAAHSKHERARAEARRLGRPGGALRAVLGSSIQFMLVERLMQSTCGFTSEMVTRDVLPAPRPSTPLGTPSLRAGKLLSDRTNEPAAALPQGMSIVTLAFSQLIMAPAYRSAVADGMGDEDAARRARRGPRLCVLLATLELVGVPFVEVLRRNIHARCSRRSPAFPPVHHDGLRRADLRRPGTALVSMLLMLMFYGGSVKLPSRCPAACSRWWWGGCWRSSPASRLHVVHGQRRRCRHRRPTRAGGGRAMTDLVGGGDGDAGGEPGRQRRRWAGRLRCCPPLCSRLHWRFLGAFGTRAFWAHLSIILPMWLVNMINNLANVEAASAVGEHYNQRTCLLGAR